MVTEKRREQIRKAQETFRRKNRLLCLQRSEVIKKKYQENRRCTSCSTPLIEGENKTCCNCGVPKGEFKYAKDMQKLTQIA
jgi:hypothetical protein